jgi:hypothetical protein
MDTYKATNSFNGKFYIGSTTNFERRKEEHLKCRDNLPFQNALRNNPEAFEWEVWSDDSDEPVLEQALLDVWFGKEWCYNINPHADRPPSRRGVTDSKETRRKKSDAKVGKIPWVNEVTGEVRRTGQCPGPGWKPGVSEKTKEKLSQINSGEKHPQFGTKKSEETLKKLVESLSGRTFTDAHKRKLSEKKQGVKHWVNEAGERKFQQESPGPGWQNGRKWKQG